MGEIDSLLGVFVSEAPCQSHLSIDFYKLP